MEFYCSYYKTIYKDNRNGYTHFLVKTEDDDVIRNEMGYVECSGYIKDLIYGTPMKVVAEINNKTHNSKVIYKISNIKFFSNSEKLSYSFIEGTFKNIKKKTIDKIMEIVGTDIFSFAMDNQAICKLSDIDNFSVSEAKKFIKKIKKMQQFQDLMEVLSDNNGTYHECEILINLYEEKAINILKTNPYFLHRKGIISFKLAENIFFSSNKDEYNEERIQSIIYEALKLGENDGNTYLEINDLFINIQRLLKDCIHSTQPSIKLLQAFLIQDWIILKKEKIYLKEKYEEECSAANSIKRLLNSSKSYTFSDELKKTLIKENNLNLSKDQEEALDILKSSGIKILTGGPGTGKTTTINLLIKGYKKMNPCSKVVLAAPTGRASQRMAEATNLNASTVHKLLEIKPFDNKYKALKDMNDPIDGDFIIIDESSMLDIELFAILLNGIKNGALLLLVGDENQLESVGAGNVLHDLIKSNIIEIFKLKEVFRQKEDSKIISNSIKIINGDYNLETDKNFVIKNIKTDKNTENLLNNVIDNIKDFDNWQFLCTNKKNSFGTYNINKKIQGKIYKEESGLKFGCNTFYIGDKVIMTQNNYKLGYFNGDVGVIKYINLYKNNDPDDEVVVIKFADKEISLNKHQLSDIQLAYAMTIHKSQGSEYENIIIVLPNSPSNMLNRNLLNTAITRSKNKVLIINEDDSINTAIKNINKTDRKTSLSDMCMSF